MKKLPNSRTMLSFALALVLAHTAHTARAQEQQDEQLIAPPPPAVFDLDTVNPDAPPPPPPSSQVLNRHQQPNVVGQHGFAPAPVQTSFFRRSYQDRFDVCVNAVAQACDGHFTRKLTRALARGTRDLVDGVTLANALRQSGISHCGHYTAKEGGLEMEAFTKGNQLILFSMPSPSEKDPKQAVCKHSVITMNAAPLNDAINDMKVSENRVWILGATGSVYYVGGNFQLHDSGTKARAIAIAPNGDKINVGAGFVKPETLTTADTIKLDRDKQASPFTDNPQVSDAAADLLPAVNALRFR